MPATDIMTPDYIRNAVLPTVRLTGVSDDAIWRKIDDAIGEVQGRTSLSLLIDHRLQVEERADTMTWEDASWFLKKALRRPIQTVTRMGFQFGNYEAEWLPPDWIHYASKKMGALQIVPGPTGIYLRSYNDWFPSMWNTDAHYMAGNVALEYYAGYDRLLDGVYSVAPNSSTVTITGATDVAYKLEPGQWVKLGANVRRIQSVIDGNSFKLTGSVTGEYEGPAIHLQYPGSVLAAIGGLAGAAVLDVAGTLLYGAGVTGKHLGMDGLVQRKGINPLGPYGTWKQQLLDAAEKAILSLYMEHVPVRAFAV